MFIKNILKAFERDTLIEVWYKDRLGLWTLDDNYTIVGQFMDSGLTTYMEVDDNCLLEVDDNRIVVYMK